MVDISVIIPALNEEKTIAKVVRDFKFQLPKAKIIVVDNNSSDKTKEQAKIFTDHVLTEYRKGKGYAMKRGLEYFDSDFYIFVDGDNTYSAADVHQLLAPVISREVDMCVGSRVAKDKSAIKTLHVFGNNVIVDLLNFCFGVKLTDILSGYRVLNREVVQQINLMSSGFEVETEMTIQVLMEQFKVKEIPVSYKSRPVGSKSKLNSFSDGFMILWTILTLFRDYRPMFFCLIISFLLTCLFVVLDSEIILIGAMQFIVMGFILHSIRSQNILLSQLIRRRK